MIEEYVIYGTKDCSFCNKAKEALDHLGLPFTYVDAPTSLFFQQEFVKKMGVRTVPQIFAIEQKDQGQTERHIGGYEELMKELF